jgi:uncharacterized protein YggE
MNEAKEQHDRIHGAVLKVLDDYGLSSSSVLESSFYAGERRELFAREKQPYEHQCSRKITILLSDVARLNGFVDALLGSGVTDIVDIEFTVTNHRAMEDQATIAAVDDAKRRALVAAQAAGVHIEGVRSMNFSDADPDAFIELGGESTSTDLNIPSRIEIRVYATIEYLAM